MADEMDKDENEGKRFIDKYNNVFESTKVLSSGGQGIVYRLTDSDLALKLPARDGEVLRDLRLNEEFEKVALLDLPEGILVTTPRTILKDTPGYVMDLLNDMRPISHFSLSPKTRKKYEGGRLPFWLAGFEDAREGACHYMHYAATGGGKRRCLVLSKAAAILARLHAAGLVYGDISPNNVFMGEGPSPRVWLIDADNLRLERLKDGGGVFTPGLGAPEIVQGRDSSRPRSDIWAFSVMTFKILSLVHPFLGSAVKGESGDDEDWADDSGDSDMTPEERAYHGDFPFIDDVNDRSNASPRGNGIPRDWIFTPQLVRLFQETLGEGRTDPSRRISMYFWAMELARAADMMVTCPACHMTYFPDHATKCPYCDTKRPAFVSVSGGGWKVYATEGDLQGGALPIPERLFKPFSLIHFDRVEGCLQVDFTTFCAQAQRGTFSPEGMHIEFVEGVK